MKCTGRTSCQCSDCEAAFLGQLSDAVNDALHRAGFSRPAKKRVREASAAQLVGEYRQPRSCAGQMSLLDLASE